MKYIAIIDDTLLSKFRTDDDNEILVVEDKHCCMRGLRIRPIARAMFITTEGEPMYLDEATLDHLSEWQRERLWKEMVTKTKEVIIDEGKKNE